jgi:hypothetical protein
MSPNTSATLAAESSTDDVNEVDDVLSLVKPTSTKKRFYDYDGDAETEVWQLSAIASDWTLTINRMAANCRNISDEVFPGIHVGDRSKITSVCRVYLQCRTND